MSFIVFYISKMDCSTEENLIRSNLSKLSGVLELEFNLFRRELSVTYQNIETSTIQQALVSIGMDPEIKKESYTQQELKLLQSNISHKDWVVLGISGTLAILAEALSYIYDLEDSPLIIVLALLSMIIGGRQTIIKGLHAIRNFILNINFLMTIAIIGAAIIGEWPEAAMVTFLFALAEMIESYSFDKARHAISKLMEVAPDTATVKTIKGAWQIKPIYELQINDVLLVRPGEKIPIDGLIINGKSSVNQAPITGESFPIEKKPGDIVFAGSINERGSFELKVTVQTKDTLIAKIIRAVEQAQSERAPTQRFVDQFAKYYTPFMVLLAISIAILPPLLANASFELWIYKALVLLVIACPCALVISTPVTIVSALATAAKNGILIKGGTYLEKGHKIKAIAFDKTGTLTYGKPQVTDIIITSELTEAMILTIAASLESHSEHPIAAAVLQQWKKINTQHNLFQVNHFEAIAGKGLVGYVNGTKYLLGNHIFIEQNDLCNTQVDSILKDLEQQGKTTLILSTQEKILAILAVTDSMRESSMEAIAALHKQGIITVMITGDNSTTAFKIAEMLRIDNVQANLLPEDKLLAIDVLLKKYGTVGMVGDGINDAPAIAKSSVGFAMGAIGTGVALETADITLMEDNLNKLPFFILLSRRTWYKLVENIALSISVKIIFFTLALFGVATLWMAVLADMGASLVVVLNGLSLLRFTEIKKRARDV